MIDASHVIQQYHADPARDDDRRRWSGNLNTGDFHLFKQALERGDTSTTQHMLDNYMCSPELSCTYDNPSNSTRWCYATELLQRFNVPGETIVEIGAGSHAPVVDQMLTNNPQTRYVVCDLVTPLLIAYHELSKQHDTHYMRSTDSLLYQTQQHRCVLLPHHMIDQLYSLGECLYYNSYSLSEMSPNEQTHYMDVIGTTGSRLLSENYMTGRGRCHLCNQQYTPMQLHVPEQLETCWTDTCAVPTNPGASIQLIHAT